MDGALPFRLLGDSTESGQCGEGGDDDRGGGRHRHHVAYEGMEVRGKSAGDRSSEWGPDEGSEDCAGDDGLNGPAERQNRCRSDGYDRHEGGIPTRP